MKKLRVYEITKEDYEKTNYRPIDVEVFEIETEDGWTYGDVIQNNGDGYVAELLYETADIMIWKTISFDEAWNGRDEDDECFEKYTVEIK